MHFCRIYLALLFVAILIAESAEQSTRGNMRQPAWKKYYATPRIKLPDDDEGNANGSGQRKWKMAPDDKWKIVDDGPKKWRMAPADGDETTKAPISKLPLLEEMTIVTKRPLGESTTQNPLLDEMTMGRKDPALTDGELTKTNNDAWNGSSSTQTATTSMVANAAEGFSASPIGVWHICLFLNFVLSILTFLLVFKLFLRHRKIGVESPKSEE